MKLTHIHIKNFKALKDLEVPLSNFVCLTGQNNAGKSSVLQAISLFISPTKLEPHHFYKVEDSIEITVTFSDIMQPDLMRFNQEPRERIKGLMDGTTLNLTRRFHSNGENELGYYTLLPKNPNFRKDVVDNALSGKRRTEEITATLQALFPGKDVPPGIGTQRAAKELIETWGEALPDEEKDLQFKSIPTGADFSINPLLPIDIYIPAVKDLKDDVSAKQGSSFGRVLTILMSRIESKLIEEKDLFAKLTSKLSRMIKDDGGIEDERLEEVKEIEKTIQEFVRESFSSVDLEIHIPPPELKTVLSTAEIFVNDGARGPLNLKGDGLRRAVVFAILRTYVKLAAKPVPAVEPGNVAPSQRGYILLFEEPEVFLHPDAQRILFDALEVFSKEHHVMVTTHSPLFLGPGSATFIRLQKMDVPPGERPYTRATPVDLTQLEPKEEFQLICFENNNAALFSKRIVLVEGDSEVIVFPHIAELANPDWHCSKHSLAFVQVRGKGSIQRYRNFFKRFEVPTFVIVDLDALIDGFDKLEPTADQKSLRSQLLREVDKTLGASAEPKSKDIKQAQASGELRAKWSEVRAAKQKLDNGEGDLTAVQTLVDEFFAWEKADSRLVALQSPANDEVKRLLADLLTSLRKSGVFVLSKGAIESYYPAMVVAGKDKPSKAQCYRNTVTTQDMMYSNCPNILHESREVPELYLICELVFQS